MQSDIIASRYANALFSIEDINSTEIEEELSFFTEVLRCNKDIFDFFISPMISPENKKKVIQKCFREKISEVTVNLLLVLSEKRREIDFFRIQQIFSRLHDKKTGKIRANITVAKKNPDNIRDEITKELASLIKTSTKNFEFENISNETVILFDTKVDEAILGGVTIRIGDQYLDASVSRYLENWKKRVASHKIEIARCWADV